jgi:hypothetical protein
VAYLLKARTVKSAETAVARGEWRYSSTIIDRYLKFTRLDVTLEQGKENFNFV